MDNKNFLAQEEATFVASENTANNEQPQGPPPDYFTDDLPPAYQVASALPTYEEAELTKEGKLDPNSIGSHAHEAEESSSDEYEVRRSNGNRTRAHLPGFTLLTFPMEDSNSASNANELADTTLLGNDFVFFTAFSTSFLFNWIGFLLTMCFCRTIAAW